MANAGVDGHRTYGHVRAFKDWFGLIPGLKPGLIVFYVGINDADFTRDGPNAFESGEPEGLRARIMSLKVVNLGLWAANALGSVLHCEAAYGGHKSADFSAAAYTQSQFTPGAAELADRNAQAFRKRLRVMIASARGYGAKVLCVTQPHRMVRQGDRTPHGIADAFGSNGKSYNGLDFDYSLRRLNQAMREECGQRQTLDLYGHPFVDSDFYDYVHNTPEGAAKIGHAMAQHIRDNGLMPASLAK